MNEAETEACTDQVLAYLPDKLLDAIEDITIYVARDRQDLAVLRAAVRESGQGRVAIPQNFRAVYLGTPVDLAADDEAEDTDRPTGVIVLNAALLRDEQDVLDTLLHEIGHALGYDEDEVAALGLE
jgi:predicted Zn-dependent protease with MMP-like domain